MSKQRIIKNILVTNLAAKGKSIASDPQTGKKIIISGDSVPEDIVDLKIIKKRSNYLEAIVLDHKRYSKYRIKPKCEHFGVCGGCKWQQIDYNYQIFYKQNEVIQTFKNIASVDITPLPIKSSPEIYNYRNKTEFTFSNNRWLTINEVQSKVQVTDKNALGFHIPKMWDKILDINTCYLQDTISNEIRKKIKIFCKEKKYEFYDLRNKNGFLRSLIIRVNEKGEVMLLFQFFENVKHNIKELLDYVNQTFANIVSLCYVINPKLNTTIYDLDIIVYKGDLYLTQYLDDLKFKIHPKSFYQTNRYQVKPLYDTILELGNLRKEDVVYDLYSGVGTITLYLSRFVKKVIGIELIKEAVEDAKQNAKINNISNVEFFYGDVRHILTKDFFNLNKPNVIILDPPREGLNAKVLEFLMLKKVPKIIYISCNPSTQARDVKEFSKIYDLQKVQALDLFPHTYHIENVVVLTLKS